MEQQGRAINISGAQVISVIAWISFLAAPWYALAAGESLRSPAVTAVLSFSALVGLLAGLYHADSVARQRREAAVITEQLKRAAIERIQRGTK